MRGNPQVMARLRGDRPDDPRPHLQVVGERNAGTNYVSQLIEANLDVVMVRSTDPARFSLASQRLPWKAREMATDAWFVASGVVWKHGRLDAAAFRRLARRDVQVVAVVKHPLSWALSMHRRPYHRGEMYADLAEFASTPWRTVRRERMNDRTAANCFEIWSAKAEAVLSLSDRGLIELWPYENVLEDQVVHLGRLADRLGVEAPITATGVDSSTKSIWGDDDRDFDQIREYYRTEAWRASVPEPVRQLAADVCGDVAARFGYTI